MEKIKAAIRDIPDFPQKGIIFKDITPVIGDPALLKCVVEELAAPYKGKGITKVAAVESRGFIFGSSMAILLGAGFVPIRKKGKLPFKTIEQSYSLEYGTATLEMHVDAVKKGDKVLLVDDLLATGGTAEACVKMIRQLGAEVVAAQFLIELGFCKGREKLPGLSVGAPILV